jgi:hypothetical protein
MYFLLRNKNVIKFNKIYEYFKINCIGSWIELLRYQH